MAPGHGLSWLRLAQRYIHSSAHRMRPATPVGVCSETLLRLCNRGELEGAMTTFQKMVDQGYTPSQSALGRLAHLCQNNGDREGFERVATFVESGGVELEASLGNSLIHGLVEGGHTGRAKAVLQELQDRGVRVRLGVINALLDASLKEKNVLSSLKLLQLLASMNSTPQLTVSIHVLELAGQLGVKGQHLALALMQLYQSTEQVVECDLAEELTAWLKQQPEKYTLSEATVDSRGVCLCCGAQLEDRSLATPHHKQLLHYANLQLSAEANSFLNNKPELYEVELFKNLVYRSGPFSAVVDGLNAAHVCSAKPNVAQMLYVASAVRDKLGGPVLVISRKHLARQVLPGKKAKPSEINQHFQPEGIHFFFTQNRVVDDHYFLYGSLASGERTYFVSNDQLGDHTAHSVPPSLVAVFRQWQRSRQVTMEAPPLRLRRRGILTLKFPLSYRVALQWNGGRERCHVPVSRDTADSVYWLCVASSST